MKRTLVRNSLLAVTVLLALWTSGLRWDLSKSDWAAWVQAIGSIGAILGALWVFNRQVLAARALEDQKRDQDDLRKAEVVSQLFGTADALTQQTLVYIRNWKGTNVDIELTLGLMRDTARALASLPPFEIPGGLAVKVLQLTRALEDLHVSTTNCHQDALSKKAFVIQAETLSPQFLKQHKDDFQLALHLAQAGGIDAAQQIEVLKQRLGYVQRGA